MLGKKIPLNDINESIEDSLVKVIREYDKEIRSTLSIRNLWRQRFDNQGMSELRGLLKNGRFGFLDAGRYALSDIKSIIEKRKLRVPDGGDNLTNKVFEYLNDRIQYYEQEQRRSPKDLTENNKVLLIGDGWVNRKDPDNPIVKRVNQEKDSEFGEELYQDLNLQHRGYNPEQVYTIDINPAQLPDFCGDVENIPINLLPKDHFDFIYFEGMVFQDNEAMEKAKQAFLPSLKNTGLMIYSTPKPGTVTKLMAKSGEITQEKLDCIPECIKKSIIRGYHIDPLERLIKPNVQEVDLIRRAEENLYLLKTDGPQSEQKPQDNVEEIKSSTQLMDTMLSGLKPTPTKKSLSQTADPQPVQKLDEMLSPQQEEPASEQESQPAYLNPFSTSCKVIK